MKGFIEVTIPESEVFIGWGAKKKVESYKKSINVNHIIDFKDKVICTSEINRVDNLYINNRMDVKESYEEIKKLIEGAQN